MALSPPRAPEAKPAQQAATEGDATASCVTATHEVLFQIREPAQCDACGGSLPDEPDDGRGLAGSGTYMWLRGDSVEVENVPLCASCAAAIGITALSRWEIEEEEG